MSTGGAQFHALLLACLIVPLSGFAAAWLANAGGAAQPKLAAILTWVIASIGAVAVSHGLERLNYPHARLGLCNTLTLLRAASIAALAGLLATPEVLDPASGLGWGLVLLALLTLSLDGVDGWAARRSGLRSDFGARFDMETDVAFALVLAALAWQSEKVGIWFLALGLIRPAFLLAGLILPALRHPLPDAFWRKTVAAVQMGGQVLILAPIVTPGLSHVLGIILMAGVTTGFAVDIRWLQRRAARAS